MTKSQLSHVATGRFFWLLMAIIGAIVWAGCIPLGTFDRWEAGIPLIGILVASTFAARGGKGRLIISLLLNVLLLVCGASWWLHPSMVTQFLTFILLLISLTFTLLTTLSFVLTTGKVTLDHIYGAICSYMMIAMIFATIYTMQALAIPGAFSGVQIPGSNERPWEAMLYFSFATLSTVGYGDIFPLHRTARAICIIEMLTGTFYVAILIARLAGLYPPHAPEDESANQ